MTVSFCAGIRLRTVDPGYPSRPRQASAPVRRMRRPLSSAALPAPVCGALREVVFECRFDFGERAVERERHSLLHLVCNARRDLIRLRGSEDAVLNQSATESRHWIATQRRFVLFTFAEHGDGFVLGIVQRHARRRDDVTVRGKPIHLGFHESWTLPRTCTLNRFANCLVDSQRICAIYGNTGHRMRLRFYGERLSGRSTGVLLCGGSYNVVAVVFHYEYHRELPQ